MDHFLTFFIYEWVIFYELLTAVGARWLSQSKVLYTKNGGLSEPKSHFTKVSDLHIVYLNAQLL